MASDACLQLTDLVEDLRAEARLESSGVFTLDPATAEEKLRNFAFLRPEDYLLKFVQAAVARGAERLEIDSGATSMELRWYGPGLEAERLCGLMGYLLSPQAGPEFRYLRHLAAGLRGSVAVSPDQLLLESGTGPDGFRRSWRAGRWETVALPGRSETFTRVYLRRQSRTILSQWLSRLSAPLFARQTPGAEERVLLEGAGLIPIPLKLNDQDFPPFRFGVERYPGYQIEQDEFPGESRAPRYVVAAQPQDFVEGCLHRKHLLIEQALEGPGSLPPLGPRTASIRLSELEPGQRCQAWLGLEAALLPQARVYLVEDGICLDELQLDWGIPGLVAILSVEDLAKDLTGFQMVQNEAYEQKMEWLKVCSQTLVLELLQRLEDIPIRERVQDTFAS